MYLGNKNIVWSTTINVETFLRRRQSPRRIKRMQNKHFFFVFIYIFIVLDKISNLVYFHSAYDAKRKFGTQSASGVSTECVGFCLFFFFLLYSDEVFEDIYLFVESSTVRCMTVSVGTDFSALHIHIAVHSVRLESGLCIWHVSFFPLQFFCRSSDFESIDSFIPGPAIRSCMHMIDCMRLCAVLDFYKRKSIFELYLFKRPLIIACFYWHQLFSSRQTLINSPGAIDIRGETDN